jgi:hypothetical protein
MFGNSPRAAVTAVVLAATLSLQSNLVFGIDVDGRFRSVILNPPIARAATPFAI